ncbi:MAG: TonB-dependent receptor [Saprospiraceae bacterium]|nr:TonB-dependent receptor [Saprospiraceae bacterium]
MRSFYLIFFLLILSWTLSAQLLTIEGTVHSSTDEEPLIGVTIMPQSGGGGTVTDFEGKFSLEVEKGAMLIFNYVGYAEQKIKVNGQTQWDIRLEPTAEILDEVVVIGYGTSRKSDLTGSVASIKSTELEKTTITSLEQGLQGRVAGVHVTQGDAAPGAGISIEIRGTNSILGGNDPLYVIDGIPITNPAAGQGALGASEPNNRIVSNTNVLATLSPSDIESIEILKDASATAIYGSRGANGVVLITTKIGQAGKGRVSLNMSYGSAQVRNKLELLNAAEFMAYQNTAYENAGFAVASWPWAPDTTQNPSKVTPSEVLALGAEAEIDWQDAVYQVAPVQDVQLGFSGGNEKGSYSVMLNYLDQEGVIKGSAFQRGGLRTNLSYQVNDWIRVAGNLALTRSQNSLVRTSTNTTQTAGGIVRSVLNYTPILPVERTLEGLVQLVEQNGTDQRLEDPSYFQLYGANPLRYTDEVTEQHNFTRAIGGLNATLSLLKGLTADIRLAANYIDRKNNSYYPRTVSEGFGLNGLAVVSSNEFTNLISENLLRYQSQLGKHRLEFMGGFTFEQNRDYWINNEARDFPDDKLSYFALQNGLSHVPTRTNTATWTLASWLARANVILHDKYLFTGTVRYDGSSKFARNNKWAPFYSFAFAWRASEEPFIKEIEAISNLKVRLSYGESGNQAISPYQSLASVNGVTTSFNNQLVPAVIEGRLENNNLRWETTAQVNVGLDVELWNGRLFSTLNYYQKETKDLLQQITLAPNTGFTSALVNAGTIENKGFEIELGGFPIRKALTWQISGNLSINRNQITDLGEVEEQFADRLGAGNGLTIFPFIQRPGLPIGSIYGFVEDGIFQNEAEVSAYEAIQGNAAIGQIRYVDLNGDGTISDQDRTIIGDVNPDFIWGLSNNFNYKNFDLSFLWQAVVGADIINTLSIRFHNLDGRRNIPRAVYEEAWEGEGSSNAFRQINLNNGNGLFSDRFVEDGSYLRLKNVQLGYTIKADKVPWLESARVYLNAINLWTLTDYTGYDPEVSAFNSAAMKGVDLGNYPQSQTFIFGLNLNF